MTLHLGIPGCYKLAAYLLALERDAFRVGQGALLILYRNYRIIHERVDGIDRGCTFGFVQRFPKVTRSNLDIKTCCFVRLINVS